jgi:hypothetical protein
MATTVRLFTFSGVVSAPRSSGDKAFATDTIGLLKYPYLAREAITANDTAQSSASDLSPAGTEILFAQIQGGKAVHIEVNTPGRTATADASSPIITGDVLFRFSAGWSVSLLEHEIT